jgi:hypothetical protein
MTTIAIVQSCYIPWKGYFDLIRRADQFVLYDCVQYTSRDWRNRNRIKTPQGLHWLTIPVNHVSQKQRICDTHISDSAWNLLHWDTLRHNYARAPYFEQYAAYIEQLYKGCAVETLSEVNLHFLQGIMNLLGITTSLHLLKEHKAEAGDPSDKLLAICRHYSATRYLSGPSASAYLDVGKFERENIGVEWMSYDHYVEYPQPHPPFEHSVSMLDLLFNVGPAWTKYMGESESTRSG